MRYLRLTALLLPALLLGCSGSEETTKQAGIQPAHLATVPVKRETVADEVMFDGTLEALHESTVASEVNARVV